MSDNAELIAKLRDVGMVHEALSYSSEAEPFHMIREAADAIERAERDAAHWHRLYIEEWIVVTPAYLENAQRDLRAAAASEAAMRERYDTIVHWAQGTVYDKIDGEVMYCEDCAGKLYDALQQLAVFASTPASALAERYEAVVKAARAHLAVNMDAGDLAYGFPVTAFADSRRVLRLALAALDHPTPAKDDEA